MKWGQRMNKKPVILAISGVKNSGKTTVITGILPLLSEKGLRVATIKHDGHDFEADVPGRDSWNHFQAGALGTAVYSDTKFLVVKRQKEPSEKDLAALFPEADLILLEGFKYSEYPKCEVIRSGNSDRSMCRSGALLAVFSDLPAQSIKNLEPGLPVLELDDPEEMADFVYHFWETARGEAAKKRKKQGRREVEKPLEIKSKVVISAEEDFFGPGVWQLLQNIDETGSIQAAAARMGMSYSKSLKLINRAEKQLGFPLLERHNGGKNGGRSDVTPEGQQFMDRYRAMREEVKQITENLFEVYFGEYL